MHGLSLALMLIGGLLSLAGFGYAFALAVKSKHLSTGGIVLGAFSLMCGFATIPFLAMGWKAVQRATFAAISEGAEPAVAGRAMAHYKKAVLATVLGLGLVIVGSNMAPKNHGRNVPSDSAFE